MFEQKFGAFPKTLVIYNDGILTIGKRELSLEDTEEVFVKEPSFAENGHVYFSKTGKPATASVHIAQRGFYFTKKQSEDVYELIDLLDIEIAQGESVFKGGITNNANTSKPKKVKNKRVCPKCKSPEIQFMDNKKKKFSVGKAVVGGALTGGVGTLAGFAGKKGKKDRWHCTNCGNVFEMKSK